MDPDAFAERIHLAIRGCMPAGEENALRKELAYGVQRVNAGQENWSALIVHLAMLIAGWLSTLQVNPETMIVRAEIEPAVLIVKMSARADAPVC